MKMNCNDCKHLGIKETKSKIPGFFSKAKCICFPVHKWVEFPEDYYCGQFKHK